MEQTQLRRKFEDSRAWGILTTIDLFNCNPELIRSDVAIRRFVVELCERISMRRFGPTQVVHFGEDERVAGYSMTQLIETSLISGHFANADNSAYIDVFSCKFYEPEEVREFAMTFFQATRGESRVVLRGVQA